MPLSSKETHSSVEEIEAVLHFAEEVSNNIRTLSALAAKRKRQIAITIIILFIFTAIFFVLRSTVILDTFGETMYRLLIYGLPFLGVFCGLLANTQIHAWRRVSADLKAERRVMKDLITLASPLIEGLNSDAGVVRQAVLHMRFRRLSFSGEKYG